MTKNDSDEGSAVAWFMCLYYQQQLLKKEK